MCIKDVWRAVRHITVLFCVFQITVITFSTEHNWDSLDFYDGVDGNAPRLGSYSGRTKAKTSSHQYDWR